MSRLIASRRAFMMAILCATGLGATGLLVARAHADGNEPMLSVTGELSYLQRIALPPDAVAFVELRQIDVADDAPATAQARIELGGKQVPIPFLLEAPRAHLQPGASYQLSGGVLVDGDVRWRAGPVAVDVSAADFDAGTLMMSQQPADEEPAAAATGQEALVGDWRIVRIGDDTLGGDVNAVLAFDDQGGFSGRLCNSFRGGYTVDGSTISFGQAAATLMACPEPLARQERELFAAFESAATFRIGDDGTLALLDDEGRALASAQR